MQFIDEKQVNRFLTRFVVDSDSGCYNWTGATSPNGYGLMWTGMKLIGAHRFSWLVFNGSDIPEGMYICHKCDNKKCVNIDHLYLGTPSDNMGDRESRITWKKSQGGNVKLSSSDAEEIRRLYKTGKYTQLEIAGRYNVSRQHISGITTGRKW